MVNLWLFAWRAPTSIKKRDQFVFDVFEKRMKANLPPPRMQKSECRRPPALILSGSVSLSKEAENALGASLRFLAAGAMTGGNQRLCARPGVESNLPANVPKAVVLHDPRGFEPGAEPCLYLRVGKSHDHGFSGRMRTKRLRDPLGPRTVGVTRKDDRVRLAERAVRVAEKQESQPRHVRVWETGLPVEVPVGMNAQLLGSPAHLGPTQKAIGLPPAAPSPEGV